MLLCWLPDPSIPAVVKEKGALEMKEAELERTRPVGGFVAVPPSGRVGATIMWVPPYVTKPMGTE